MLWRDESPTAAAFARLVFDLRHVAAQPPTARHAPAHGTRWLAERSRVAQQLHHAVLQDVFGTQLHLQALGRRPPSDRVEVRAVVGDAVEGLARVGRTVRDAMRAIPTAEPHPGDLALALMSAGTGFGASSGAEFRLRTVGAPRVLRRDVELLAYRVGNEALESAFARPATTQVSVSLHYGDAGCCLSVADDGRDDGDGAGVGAGARALAAAPHQAEAVGAALTVRRDPAVGARVELHVPHGAAFAAG
jgi:two-component system sensor histidine kinase UhpB